MLCQMCDPQSSGIGVTWELVRNAEEQAPSQSCVLVNFPGDSWARCSLRSTASRGIP